jgi:DNA-directed RNA polymerase III subunit RPC1
MSSVDIVRNSVVEVVNRQLFVPHTMIQQKHGPLDPRLGISIRKLKCATCGCDLNECVGHFGHIKLALPVFHIGYMRHILTTLQAICKYCGRILIQENFNRLKNVDALRQANFDPLKRRNIVKKCIEEVFNYIFF